MGTSCMSYDGWESARERDRKETLNFELLTDDEGKSFLGAIVPGIRISHIYPIDKSDQNPDNQYFGSSFLKCWHFGHFF